MLIRELFRTLSFEELSSHSIGSDGAGSIEESKIPRMIELVNTSLLELYTQFCLKESELVIQTIEWKNSYELRVEHALTHPSESIKFILDSVRNPYEGDLIKVISVVNEAGKTMPLNDIENCASVFTPKYNVVQINHHDCPQIFSVVYQAEHPKLVSDIGSDVMDQWVDIPPALEEALRIAIATKIYSAMSGQDISNKLQLLQSRYEYLCHRADSQNLIGDSYTSTNLKLHKRGYV